ncbi:MAG: oxygen-dependent coproporphyrinogen oxidase [Gemmatimonadales bacterium]|nr:MAG: oxygen-dependent coproporphyrinogen oxidase [Gemmatimonadales bacterium]
MSSHAPIPDSLGPDPALLNGGTSIPDVLAPTSRALPAPRPGTTWAPEDPAAVEEGPLRMRVSRWMQRLHDTLTDFFEDRDGGGRFQEDAWLRPGGGGGVSRVLTDGQTFEKAGVNRFAGGGAIPSEVATRLGARGLSDGPVEFYATGVSIVCHPRSPMLPIVHMNVRYFELEAEDGSRLDYWFGGGIDLTPTHPFPEDAVHFHRTLKEICDRHHPEFYDRGKAWCDKYFVNGHRDGEMRGIGGIFFDNLRGGGDEELSTEDIFAFVRDVGLAMRPAYGPLVERHRDNPWGARERELQLFRRGRYVEFNLVHDRGTRFGLQTNARIESVLMSLPPLARWGYCEEFDEGTFEHRLHQMLEPHDWVDGVPDHLLLPVR